MTSDAMIQLLFYTDTKVIHQALVLQHQPNLRWEYRGMSLNTTGMAEAIRFWLCLRADNVVLFEHIGHNPQLDELDALHKLRTALSTIVSESAKLLLAAGKAVGTKDFAWIYRFRSNFPVTPIDIEVPKKPVIPLTELDVAPILLDNKVTPTFEYSLESTFGKSPIDLHTNYTGTGGLTQLHTTHPDFLSPKHPQLEDTLGAIIRSYYAKQAERDRKYAIIVTTWVEKCRKLMETKGRLLRLLSGEEKSPAVVFVDLGTRESQYNVNLN